MAAPTHRDLETTRKTLTHWLQQKMPDATDIDISRLSAADSGVSSETLFVDVTTTRSGEKTSNHWVLRIEASRMQVYQDPAVRKQFDIMDALGRHTEIPVPGTHWFEADPAVLGAPFFIMDRIEGRVPPELYNADGWLVDMNPGDREALWLDAVRNLTLIHRTDLAVVDFLNRPELGPTGLDQELECWKRYFEWSEIPRLPVLERGQKWLLDHAPADRPTGLAWGDARISNMIFDGTRCTAVIDWETVSLGGAEEDLGWWLVSDQFYADMMGVKRLEGLGDRAATIAAWEEFSGRRARDIEWHEIFATWRYAMISERAIKLYAENGTPLQGIASGEGNPYVVSLSRLLAAGS